MVTLSERVDYLESKLNEQKDTFERRLRDHEKTVTSSRAVSCSDDTDLRKRVKSLENVSTANEMNLNAAQRQLSEIHFNMEKFSQQARNTADNIEFRLFALETAGYSGVLIWKINFKQAMADAKSGVKVRTHAEISRIDSLREPVRKAWLFPNQSTFPINVLQLK